MRAVTEQQRQVRGPRPAPVIGNVRDAVSPTVYIVDDDAAVRAGMSMLVRSCGWQVCTCDSAQEFLRRYCDGGRGCLVLDLQMPGMSGPELQELLTELAIELPVIVVTAYKDHPLADRARAVGARAVIAKPFGEEELIREIESALDEG